MKYLTLQTVTRGKTRHRAGSEIELPDETAANLLARKPPAIARIAVAAAVTAPATGENAKDTIARIKAGAVDDTLEALEATELGREGGPRKTVLDAITARIEEISAPGDDDGEGAE